MPSHQPLFPLFCPGNLQRPPHRDRANFSKPYSSGRKPAIGKTGISLR
jgi:hypothetical protein